MDESLRPLCQSTPRLVLPLGEGEQQSVLYLAPITTLAFLLRFFVVCIVLRNHSAIWFFNQATELGNLAVSIDSGKGFSSPFGGSTGPSAFLAPGYPLFVSAIFLLFGEYTRVSAFVLMLFQALFGAGTIAVLVYLGSRVFGNRTANFAGLICAGSLPLLFSPVSFWETSLSTLLFTTLVAASLDLRNASLAKWIAFGAISGFTIMTNPALLPVTAIGLIWAFWQSASSCRLNSLAAAGVALLLCLPWAVRNAQALHTFVPLRSNKGYELWQGNRPGADGFFDLNLHPNVNADEYKEYSQLGEVAYMRQKRALATQSILSNPHRFLKITVRRMLCFWFGKARASSNGLSLYICLSSVLGLGGTLQLVRQQFRVGVLFLLPLLAFPLPYYITHPDLRFRLVLDPLLILMGVWCLQGSFRCIRETRTPRVL